MSGSITGILWNCVGLQQIYWVGYIGVTPTVMATQGVHHGKMDAQAME